MNLMDQVLGSLFLTNGHTLCDLTQFSSFKHYVLCWQLLSLHLQPTPLLWTPDWVLTISTEVSKRHLNFHFPSTSSLRLPQLSSWQLHSSSYSGQKSQHPSQFLYFSHTPYLIHQILSALHSNCIQNLTTSYNPNPPPWSRPPSFLTWITQRAS